MHKRPTAAQHAAAELVARGSVRVILTTNFDRLLEQALEQRGLAPQVIHRADQIAAMMPLAHSRVTVIKLHGGYADLDKRNTVDELATYPPELERLLASVRRSASTTRSCSSMWRTGSGRARLSRAVHRPAFYGTALEVVRQKEPWPPSTTTPVRRQVWQAHYPQPGTRVPAAASVDHVDRRWPRPFARGRTAMDRRGLDRIESHPVTTQADGNQGLITSSLLAGFIAGFIWMAITVLVGGYAKGAVVGGGFGFLVGTAIVTAIIAKLVRGRARP